MKSLILGVAFVLAFLASAFAQNPSEQKTAVAAVAAANPTYRLEFTIAETQDGKKSNVRNYVVLVQRGAERDSVPEAELKATSREPVPTGSFQPGGTAANAVVNTQFQYVDAGVVINCHLWGTESNLFLSSDISISGLKSMIDIGGGNRQPIIRNYHNKTLTEIGNGKPTMIATLDDVDAPRSLGISVTATKVK